MQTQLKTNELYEDQDASLQHDAHVRAFEALSLGIKIVFCDSRGVPVSDALAPMSSYLPQTSYNM